MKRLTLFFLSAMIAIPAWARQDIDGSFQRLSADRRSLIKELLEGVLTDPVSVQYRRLREIKTAKGTAICGEYNSRNRMGGYTGFDVFIIYRGGDGRYTLESPALFKHSELGAGARDIIKILGC